MSRGERIAAGSIAIGCLVLAMKCGGLVDHRQRRRSIPMRWKASSTSRPPIALAALRFAAIPPDANHPYGHDKAEFFAAVIEGVLIVIAALSIFRHAWETLQAPHRLAMRAGIALNASPRC